MILRCAASYDPMLDIAFIWAIDFRVIDFDSEWQHYERVMVGSYSLTGGLSTPYWYCLFFPILFFLSPCFCFLSLRVTMAAAT